MCTEGSASPNNFAVADRGERGTSVPGALSVLERDASTTTPLGIGGIVAPIPDVQTGEFERINSWNVSI
jgi:hypothetical protein